mgnify:CR=1 FL=1
MSEMRAQSQASRIERLVEVLDFLSAAIFVESMVTVETTEDDCLAKLEERMNSFAKDYIRATIESDHRLETIRMQKEAIDRLSTPILDISDGVLLVPIVGTLDEGRAAELASTLLDAIVEKSAVTAIIDLTGVEHSGAEVAIPLVRLIDATRLLGCQTIVSGIRPQLASKLVESGGEIGGAKIAARLKDALRMSVGPSMNRRKP